MNMTSKQDRLTIQALSKQGLTDREIATKLRFSLHTVRKWRRRLRDKGLSAAVSSIGRPPRGYLSTFPGEMVKTLRDWRQAHPGWGAKTLRAELAREAVFEGQTLPSLASLIRWLKQAGFSQPYQKHTQLPANRLSPVSHSHEEWEMDARGQERLEHLGMISLVDLNDVFSRVKLISYPCWLGHERVERYPNMEDYQLILRLAFTQWGRPERIAVDRAHVFYDEQGKSPFPTRLHLWLLGLEIALTFGRPGQPKDQAVTEHSHQTWYAQVLEGQSFGRLVDLYRALQERRTFLNEWLPCATLGELPPLRAYPEARQSQRPYRPEYEAELFSIQRVYEYLATCHWFRKSSKVGTVSLGGHNYSLGKGWYACEVEVDFDPGEACFVFSAAPRTQLRLPNRWITPQALMGTITNWPLSTYQLPLPFTWQQMAALQLLGGDMIL